MSANDPRAGGGDDDRALAPRRAWYLACAAADLRRRPLARTILGDPLVLFRTASGAPAALLDRCPHRGLPLSAGAVRGEHVQCAYHGWQFDAGGACRLVPALGRGAPQAGAAVPAYRAVESQGYVWIFGEPDAVPSESPFRFPLLDAEGYASVRMASEVDASLHATVENMLDVPHTAFLHRGLFRGGPRRPLTAVVRRFGDRVEAEYLGEPRPTGLLARLLAPRGGTVEHVDRFVLPSIAEVEYRLGTSHVRVTNVLTPVNDHRTRFVSVVSFRLPVPFFVVNAVLAPIARGILRQDARILRLQTENARRFGGERPVSTDADLVGPHVRRLLNAAREQAIVPGAGVEFEKRVEIWV